MSLDQGPQPVALTWPGHKPCVGLYVHLCAWGAQGLQGTSVRVAASSCPHVWGPWGRREVCVCVWCTRLSVWQGDPCQGVHGDRGMFARVSVIVPGLHACGECIRVCRSLSVWNVWCLRVHVHICTWGGRGCPCVGCTRVCVFSMFVESTRVCMYSPALADPGPHGRRHSLLFLLILLALPPTPPWSRWVPAGGYIQVSRAPCCP